MFNRKAIVTTAGLAVAISLTACTGAPAATPDPTEESSAPASSTSTDGLSGEITFQTWSLKNDRFTPYFEDLIADFTAENPDVKINWMDQPGDGYEEKVLQQANSNSLPDVVNLNGSFAYRLADAGALVNLRDAAQESLDLYIEGAIAEYTFDDLGVEGVYGYPWYQGTDVNWWNMEMLEQAGKTEADLPTTIEELFDFAIEVAEATDGAVKVIPEAPKMGTLSNAGLEIFQDGKFVLNTPEAVEVVQRYKDAYEAGAMPAEALLGEYQGKTVLYKEGKVAHASGAAGFASEMANDTPTLLENSIPTPRTGNPSLFGQGISVSANSEHPDTALAFAQFVTNTENQIEFLKLAQGFFPGTKEANSDPEAFTSVIELPAQREAANIAAAEIDKAVNEYPIAHTDPMDTYFKQQVALAVQGDISIEEALQKAEDNANEILES